MLHTWAWTIVVPVLFTRTLIVLPLSTISITTVLIANLSVVPPDIFAERALAIWLPDAFSFLCNVDCGVLPLFYLTCFLTLASPSKRPKSSLRAITRSDGSSSAVSDVKLTMSAYRMLPARHSDTYVFTVNVSVTRKRD